jgi:hypothetical protein
MGSIEALQGRADQERLDWCRNNGFKMAMPKWPGMYNPDGGTRLYLFAKEGKGIDLDSLVEALNRLPSPVMESDWKGKSHAQPTLRGPKARTNPLAIY